MRRKLTALLLSALTVACSPREPAATQSSAGRFGAVDASDASARGAALLGKAAADTAVVAMDAGITGDRISGLLELPKDQCAIVIARAGDSIDDVDLFVYGEDGSVIGTDEAPDKTPALLVCPPHPPRLWVAARIASGHGLVAIGAQRVRPADADRAATLYGLRVGEQGASERINSWPGLDERIEAHRRDLGGGWQDVRRVPVPLDARLPTRISAQVDAGRCLDALVIPADEVSHVELSLLDADGAILGRAESNGRERWVVVCSPIETQVSLEIRPQSGRGLGVLMLSRTRPGSVHELDTTVTRLEAFPVGPLEAEVRTRETTLGRAGYAGGRQLASGTLEVGRRSSVPLVLGAGCSRIDLVGGEPLGGLEAWLWSPSGALLSQAASGGHALLFACGPAGAARLDLEATLRGGPFAVLVHSESETHAALAAVPLAAGRLLAHVVERGLLARPSEIGQVTQLSLSPTELRSIEVTVPFGRCVDVSLALDSGAVGAEVRLVAVSTGAQVALGRGPHVTSARACSLDAPSAQANLKTRAELRVASGAGYGLVSTRMLSPKQ